MALAQAASALRLGAGGAVAAPSRALAVYGGGANAGVRPGSNPGGLGAKIRAMAGRFQQRPPAEQQQRPPAASTLSTLSARLRTGGRERAEEEAQVTDFVETHHLDPYIGEAMLMLTVQQRQQVYHPPLNVERARNPNGVVMSRVKQVAPVEQRVRMFIKVNDLGEGVIDRLTTLTADECEAVMDSGLKIQRAKNPSGVAMKRITEVLKTMGGRGGRPINLHGKQAEGQGRDERRGRDDRPDNRPVGSSNAFSVQLHRGRDNSGGHGHQQGGRDRSRSRGRGGRREAERPAASDEIPPDVKQLVE
ncbi:unnamed protein product, partial [Polarella glacialis]